jgi:hypothetical protein
MFMRPSSSSSKNNSITNFTKELKEKDSLIKELKKLTEEANDYAYHRNGKALQPQIIERNGKQIIIIPVEERY